MATAGEQNMDALVHFLCPHESQKIAWAYSNGSEVQSKRITSSDVTIEACAPDQSSALGCSAVVVKSITDYPFMVPGHHTNGLAVHRSHHYLAYAINNVSSSSKGGGMLRVINSSNNKRGLVKGLQGLVMDISFAWMLDKVLLAFTDTRGGFHVYQVDEDEDEKAISMTLILEVSGPSSLTEDAGHLQQHHRVTWCRYIPENPAEQQPIDDIQPHLLAVTLGHVVEVWQLYRLTVDRSTLPATRISHDAAHPARVGKFSFTDAVTATAISPDSTCVAIASMNGFVKFYQVDGSINNKQEEGEEVLEGSDDCVHQWQPHDSSPVTCLFFLDNHTAAQHDQESIDAGIGSFWKFAVTGTRNNTELKVWTCSSWTCLQVIRFNLPSPASGVSPAQLSSPIVTGAAASAPHSTSHSPSVVARGSSLSPSLLTHSTPTVGAASGGLLLYMDDTSSYLIAADQARKVVYIIMFDYVMNPGNNIKVEEEEEEQQQQEEEEDEEVARDMNRPLNNSGSDDAIKRAVSVSEIPVQFVPLCIAVNAANIKSYPRWKHHTQHDTVNNDGGEGGESGMVRGLVMHCNILTTKSLLQCSVRLQPDLPSPADDDTPAADPILVAAADGLLDITSNSSNRDIHDGLTDLSLSMSEADMSYSAACLQPITSPAPAHAPPHAATGDPVLLSPDHFTASTAAAAASKAALDSATAKLPLAPEQEVFVAPLATSESATSSSGPAATSGCSSTSSPSLEIQQILHQHDHTTDKSSSCSSSSSSSSNSRGPTQLEMAEEDLPLPPTQRLRQHQQEEEDQPEALRQQLPADAGPAGEPCPPTAAEGGDSPLAAAVAVCEEERQRQAVRQIHHKLMEEQRIRETKREQEHIKDQQKQLHKLHQDKIFLRNGCSLPPSARTGGAVPSTVAVTAGDGAAFSSAVILTTPTRPKQSPATTNFLQTFMPGHKDAPANSSTNSSPNTVNVLGDIFRAGDSLLPQQLTTCEQLEAKIKGNPSSTNGSSTQSTVNGVVPPIIVPIGSSTAAGSLQHTADDSSINGAPAAKAYHSSAPSLSNSKHNSLQRITQDTTLPAADSIPSLLSLTIRDNTTTAAAAPVLSKLGTVSAGSNTDNDTACPSCEGQQARLPTASVGVQAMQPLSQTPVVLCKHPDNSNASELKELRTLLLATQQQINKLSKKLEEVSSSQSRHQSNSTQMVANTLRPAVETALRTEIRQSLPNSVSKGLEGAVGLQLPHELQRMVTATEARLADNMSKMIHSRAFSEGLSTGVCASIAPTVTAACRDAYTKLVLPGFNTLTSRILQQFNDLFHKGTTEYLLQVKSEVSAVVSCVEGSKTATVREMEASKAAVTALLQAHQDILQQHQAAMQHHASHVVSEAVVRRIVTEEVGRVLGVLQRPLPPGTPAPGYYVAGGDKPHSPKQAQLHLEQLIAAKQFNSAFKQALSGSDVGQVLFVCERVNRESLMVSGNSKLSQEVLLSLVNQLSYDLGQKTDLKMKFLEDALLCIDTTHPITRDHFTIVAGTMQRNIQAYLDTSPPQPNRFKMLLLASSHHAAAAAATGAPTMQ